MQSGEWSLWTLLRLDRVSVRNFGSSRAAADQNFGTTNAAANAVGLFLIMRQDKNTNFSSADRKKRAAAAMNATIAAAAAAAHLGLPSNRRGAAWRRRQESLYTIHCLRQATDFDLPGLLRMGSRLTDTRHPGTCPRPASLNSDSSLLTYKWWAAARCSTGSR